LTPKNGAIITKVVITANAVANTPPTSYYVDGAATETSIVWDGVTGASSAMLASSSLKIQNRQYAPESGGATTQLHIKSIEVTYTEPQCTNAGLSFDVETVSKTTADVGFTEAATSDNASDVISYTSSDETVAAVDAAGAVTIVGRGTTIITAEQSGNATYCAGSDSYTLEVGFSAADLTEFELVTDNNQLISDGEYIIVANPTAGTTKGEFVALGYQDGTMRSYVIVGAPTASSIFVPVATANTDQASVYMLQLGGSTDAWTLTDIVNDEMLAPTGGNGLQLEADATWSINIDDETSVATIMSLTSDRENDRIQYNNSTSPRFVCYTSEQAPVYLYATPETLDNAATGISTAVTDNDDVVASKYYNLQGQEVVPQAGGFYVVKNIHASGKVSVSKEFKK
jgi:hypothetical protein